MRKADGSWETTKIYFIMIIIFYSDQTVDAYNQS